MTPPEDDARMDATIVSWNPRFGTASYFIVEGNELVDATVGVPMSKERAREIAEEVGAEFIVQGEGA